MIETMRSEFPAEMNRAARFPEMGTMEKFSNEALDHLKEYARENPVAFGCWAFGIGFVLGWRLKPW